MRKTIIALIIVLPLVFVLVIFSSLNLISLSVDVAVNGIQIVREEGEDGLRLDLAEYEPVKIKAEVTPSNATNKDYELVSENEDVLEIAQDGTLIPKAVGNTSVVATSSDKGFKDSMPVTVTSSKAYAFEFELFEDETKTENKLRKTGTGQYKATLDTGKYYYSMSIQPGDFEAYEITSDDEYAMTDKAAGTLFLPFSGTVNLTVKVPDAVDGELEKTVALTVRKPRGSSILVNGSTDGSMVQLIKGATTAYLYVQSETTPSFSARGAVCEKVESLGGDRYRLEISLAEGEEEIRGSVTAGEAVVTVGFTYSDFAFTLTSQRQIAELEDGTLETYVLANLSNSFHAVSQIEAADISYEWSIEGENENVLTVSDDGGRTCTLKPTKAGNFTLTVKATQNGKEIGSKKLNVRSYEKVDTVLIRNQELAAGGVDLAKAYTLAGKKFNAQWGLEDNLYELAVLKYMQNGERAYDAQNLLFTTSDDSIVEVVMADGKAYLRAKGAGNVTVTASWEGNELFGGKAQATINLNVVGDAVAVDSAPALRYAMDEGIKAALVGDIMLGTGSDGKMLSAEERRQSVGKMKSTYNIEWYKNAPDASEDDAVVMYAQEFTADVYGNGHNINAEYITHAMESSGNKPLIYLGPLHFVKCSNLARVAGQDNCSFLIRTKGVKLYGVNLLGCSDGTFESTQYPGKDDLALLNNVGTVLEVNESCEIVNCRLRNGRNIIRVYGGNKDGNNYFVTNLAQSTNVAEERINVTIDGCILYNGREFLVKLGTNRALKSRQGVAEPKLTDANGRSYEPEAKNSNYFGELYKDKYFYDHYVLTDLTIQDSVLESSGLFTVGVESNFAGPMLAPGYTGLAANLVKEWYGSGGTSFAAVLRLKGDVRLYDWKNVALVDSKSLIEMLSSEAPNWLNLDIRAMITAVTSKHEELSDLIEKRDGSDFVHGGVAFYGGGINYSALDISELDEGLADLKHVNINLNIISNEEGNLGQQGGLLPLAAGNNDFNFWMYTSSSANNYDKQLADAKDNSRYKGVGAKDLFPPAA